MWKFWKNGRFSGRIWLDWGNTAWADMAGLGSKGLRKTGVFTSRYQQVFIFPISSFDKFFLIHKQFQQIVLLSVDHSNVQFTLTHK